MALLVRRDISLQVRQLRAARPGEFAPLAGCFHLLHKVMSLICRHARVLAYANENRCLARIAGIGCKVICWMRAITGFFAHAAVPRGTRITA